MSYSNLTELPTPPMNKTGWPWNEECSPLSVTVMDHSPWPRLSIVTPSYNQAPFIEETIRSVLLQGYPHLEYIIIDGGSTDGSVEIIRKYEPWLAYWVSEPDKGQSQAINKGFKHATGEIFAWINSDDFYMPNAFENIARAFTQNPNADLIYGNCHAIDRDGKLLHENTQVKDYDYQWLLEQGNLISQPSAFFRQEAFFEVGSIDESLHFVMDWDLWLRLGAHGLAIYLPKLLSKMHVYPEAKSSSGGRPRFDEIRRMLANHGGKGITKSFEEILVWERKTKAFEAYKQGDFQTGQEEIGYILQNVPEWRINTRLLALDIADQAWSLYRDLPTDDKKPFEFAEKVCLHLPSEASPALVRKQTLALLSEARAFQCYQNGAHKEVLNYALRAITYNPKFISNRGLISVFFRSLFIQGKL